MRKILLFITLILLISSVSAFNITTFNNSLSSELLTNFTDRLNVTRHINFNGIDFIRDGVINLAERNSSEYYINYTILSGVVGGLSTLTGVYNNGTYYFLTDTVNKRIVMLNATYNVSGAYIDISPYSSSPTGITGNGSDFWTSDYITDAVTHYNRTWGFIENFSIGSYSANSMGLHYNGSNFWLADYVYNSIYYTNRTLGLISNFSFGADPTGVYNNGTNLFITDDNTNLLYITNLNGNILSTRLFNSASVNPQTMWTDGIDYYVIGAGGNAYLIYYPYSSLINLGISGNNTLIKKGNPLQTTYNNFSQSVNQFLINCTTSGINCQYPIKFDTYGMRRQVNITSLYFFYPFLINNYSQTYTSFSSITNNFKINLTYDSNYYNSINVYLNYNNTNYTMSTSDSGQTQQYSVNAISPTLTTTQNVSFYYIILLNNGSGIEQYNTKQYNQTILSLKYGFCNATNTIKFLNFSMKSESTRSNLNYLSHNTSYNIDIKIGDALLSSYIQFSTNMSADTLALCLNTTPTSDLRYDYQIQYTAIGHTLEYVNKQNLTLNASYLGQNITLYPLNNSLSETFLIKVKSSSGLVIKDAVVEIYRKYVDTGSYELVESPITDSLGQTTGHFTKNDIMYNLLIRKNNVTLFAYENVVVYCNTLTNECILNLNAQPISRPIDNLKYFRDITYVATYNDETRKYYISYTSNSGSSKNVTVYGFRLTNTQNETLCYNSLSAVSGTVICDLSSFNNGTRVLINAYVNNELLLSDYITLKYRHNTELPRIRYVLMAFLLPFFVGLALASGGLAVVFYLLGLILGISIFALDTQSVLGASSFLIWFIVAGIVLIYKIMKGGQKNG